MDRQRPRGREKNVSGPAKQVQKRGDGLGSGPVGGSGPNGRGAGGAGAGSRGGGNRGGLKLLVLLAVLLLGGGGGMTALMGGQSDQAALPSHAAHSVQPAGGLDLASLLNGLGGGSVSSGWQSQPNTGRLDAAVDPAARAKRVQLLGGGQDTATVMVYMCGTDLESRSGMGTADLQEMLAAQLGDRVNLLVYTGGCSGWRNDQVSSRTNQIWQIRDGGMACLERDLGSVSMTDPSVLTGFIRYCAERFPASRYELIFWDHGGGSISGYGYDEKFASSGSMGLPAIDRALTDAGVAFDFIGFDACLMATAETALTMAKHADYLIASEETEPGVGWYYTDWLTAFGEDPSLPTIQLGRRIADDFVDVCAQRCAGQLTTLSVVDLAELEATLPNALAAFSQSAGRLISGKSYETLSAARAGAREFAQSSRIDHVDLVHLAQNLGGDEADALASALLSAVKYNRTSSNMTNAYGLSIYFPYQKASAVGKAVAEYQKIDMDKDYIRCIQSFAEVAQGGQGVSNAPSTPLTALLGGSGGGDDAVAQLLEGLFSSGLLSGRAMPQKELEEYYQAHRLDQGALTWRDNGSGTPAISLPEEQWALVHSLDLNLFYDDGAGYIDLGLDNVYGFDEAGNLLGVNDGSWLAVNGQPVAYYHTSTLDEGEHYAINGYVPVLHNGRRAELLLTFDDQQPYGYVSGIRPVYGPEETLTVAKSASALQPGDTLDFLCDYYGYDGSYQDSYRLGDPLVVTEEELTISDVPLDGTVRAVYRFTDLYNQHYWTTPIP